MAGNAPSALQWTFAYPAGDVSALSATSGASLVAAGKTLTCNSVAGSMTCLATGMNATNIGSGAIATVTVTLAASTSGSTIPVSVTQPLAVTAAGNAMMTTGTGGVISVVSGAVISSLLCAPSNLSSGASSTCTVTLSTAAPSGGATVMLSDNSSVLSGPASVIVAAGSTTATFSVTAGNFSSDQTATVTATLNGVSKTASIALVASMTLTSLACSPASLSSSASSTCTVTLSKAPTAATAVSLSDNNGALTVPSSVNVSTGSTTATFSATAGTITSNQSATITASLNGTSASTTISLLGAASTSGLISAFNLDEGSGAIVSDLSGTGITGQIQGATWTASGKYGSALSFNGTTSYVDLGSPAAFQTTGSMTWSAWVYPTAHPWDDGNIVAISDGTNGWHFKTTPDTGVRTFAILISNGVNYTQRNSTTVVALNTWYHVAAVYNAPSQTLDLYVNGVLDNGLLTGNAAIPAAMAIPNLPATIGKRSGGFYFQGTIDNLRIYNRALSAPEVSSDKSTPVTAGGGIVPSLSSLTCSPTSLGSAGSSTCTVSLSSVATTAIAVTLADNNALLTTPASVTVASGANTADFTATSSTITSNQSATVTATLSGVSQTATINLVAPVTLTSLACSPTSLGSSASSTCTVTLSRSATAATAVTLSDNNTLLTTQASVTVASGATTATFTITSSTITSDQSATVTATLSGVSQTATISLVAPVTLTSLACSPSSLGSSASSNCTVTLSKAATAATAVALSDNNALLTTPASVTVASGATTATFSVTAGTITSDQSATVTATLSGVSKTATISLAASVTLTSLACSPTSLNSSASSTCTVTLSKAATAATAVTLSDNSTLLTTPASVTVASGATTATFTVTAGTITSDQGAIVTAGLNGVSKTATISLAAPITLTSLACSPTSLSSSASTTCTVTLSKAAATGGAVIALSDDSSRLTVPSSVTVAAGSATATFTATAGSISSNRTVTITATFNGVSKIVSISLLRRTTQPPTRSVEVSGIPPESSGAPTSLACSSHTVTAGTSVRCELQVEPSVDPEPISLTSGSENLKIPSTVTPRANQSRLTFLAFAEPDGTQESVVVTATLGSSRTDETVLVLPAPGPVIKAPSRQLAKVGAETTFSVGVIDPAGLPVQLAATGIPAGAVLALESGRFEWTPTASQEGTYDLALTATNSARQSSTSHVNIEVGSGVPALDKQEGLACSPGARASLTGNWLAGSGTGATTVRVNDQSMPVLYSSLTRIDFLCPNLEPGISLSATVETAAGTSAALRTEMHAASPRILQPRDLPGAQGYISFPASSELAWERNYRVPSHPAQPGDDLQIWATGLGSVGDAPFAGLSVMIGGTPAEIESVDAVADHPGVSIIRVRVPSAAVLGDAVPVFLQIETDGQRWQSNRVTISVEEGQ